MTNDINAMLGSDDGRPVAKRRPKKRANLGPLHQLLTEKLPDLIDENGEVCDLHRLAKELALTYQGVYKWTSQDRLPFKQVKRIISLSQRQKRSKLHPSQVEFYADSPFEPATEADFLPYIA